MKKLFFISILPLLLYSGFAQEIDLKSNFSISVVTYPDYLRDLNSNQTQKLESKLLQMVSSYGISGVDFSDRFVLYPEYRVDEYKVIENTTRNIHIVRGELTVFVKENETNKVFGTLAIPIEGNGRTKDAAFLKSISTVKIKNDRTEEFLDEVMGKINKYYKINCNQILKEAELNLANGDIKKAINNLVGFPSEMLEVGNCSEALTKMTIRINRQAVNQNCLDIIRRVEKLRFENEESYYALALLEYINNDSKCHSTAEKIKQLFNKKKSGNTIEKTPLESDGQNQEIDLNIDIELMKNKARYAFDYEKYKSTQEKINNNKSFAFLRLLALKI